MSVVLSEMPWIQEEIPPAEAFVNTGNPKRLVETVAAVDGKPSSA
jgi:hypothetical protein